MQKCLCTVVREAAAVGANSAQQSRSGWSGPPAARSHCSTTGNSPRRPRPSRRARRGGLLRRRRQIFAAALDGKAPTLPPPGGGAATDGEVASERLPAPASRAATRMRLITKVPRLGIVRRAWCRGHLSCDLVPNYAPRNGIFPLRRTECMSHGRVTPADGARCAGRASLDGYLQARAVDRARAFSAVTDRGFALPHRSSTTR